MKLVIFLCIIVLLIILHYIYSSETKWVLSNIDNRYYLIKSNNLSNSQEYTKNANTLAEINRRIEILIKEVSPRYPKLKELYKPEGLSEAAIDERFTSFTVNKNDIHLCLRTRNDSKQLYDIDRLMYVMLHELAHMANWNSNGEPIIGHGPEFLEIFRDLVRTSIKLSLYQYTDYSKTPVEYCGIMIYNNVVA